MRRLAIAPMSVLAGLAALLAASGCSAPANLSELASAEASERRGDDARALVEYRKAQQSCQKIDPPRRRRELCAMALLGEAEVLERQGKPREAIAAYAAIPTKSGGDAPPSAQGLYRAGALTLEQGDGHEKTAWTYLWKVVTDYPDEAFAGDAIALLLRDGRSRDPKALAADMARLGTALGDAGVADNIVWALADLTEHELADPKGARALYDRIPEDHPRSGLRDDARWHGARLSKVIGDPPGAVTRLRALLATREVARIGGSYFSVWLDDGQLELGRVLRDDVGDLPGAIAAFRKLPKDYPDSILRDDAAIELAETLARAGDAAAACAELSAMSDRYPDSKYLSERAPALATRLACPKKVAKP